MAKQIEREVGSLLLTDKVMLDITRPDAATQGSAVDAMVSCTGVEVTNDLQVVKVYVSVYTTDTAVKERTLIRLNGLAGYMRSRISEQVRLRLTPEVRFLNDESFVRGERVLELLQLAERERSEPPRHLSTSSAPENEDDDDGEDDGFFVLEGDDGEEQDDDTPGTRSSPTASTPQQADVKPKVNRFLVGLDDDSDEDEDEDAVRKFFAASDFPDAEPELETLEARQKALLWQDKQGKRGAKGKGRPARISRPR